jgi:electron transfer flavoprotein alpha subunit
MAEAKGILIIGESSNGAPANSTLGLVAGGRKLLEFFPGESVSVLVTGSSAGQIANSLGAHGADIIYKIEDSKFDDLNADLLVAAAHLAYEAAKPRIIIGAKSLVGRDVMPRLAFRIGTALAQDCTALGITNDGRLTASRPVYGGNAIATVVCNTVPSMATLREKVFEPLPADATLSAQMIELPSPDENVIRTRLIERVETPSEGVRLEDAKVVVSGGRGLGGPEPFEHLETLARMLKGAVGASRAACDAGWVPSSYQVGLTGKTVTPDLYIAVGISGASQHMAGCGSARNIVAINKDPGANIFKEARYGVTGDWQKVLPAFIEQLHELLE